MMHIISLRFSPTTRGSRYEYYYLLLLNNCSISGKKERAPLPANADAKTARPPGDENDTDVDGSLRR